MASSRRLSTVSIRTRPYDSGEGSGRPAARTTGKASSSCSEKESANPCRTTGSCSRRDHRGRRTGRRGSGSRRPDEGWKPVRKPEHILYVVRDGKIVTLKEYHDTLHASLSLVPDFSDLRCSDVSSVHAGEESLASLFPRIAKKAVRAGPGSAVVWSTIVLLKPYPLSGCIGC
jgi:hypothetical protein